MSTQPRRSYGGCWTCKKAKRKCDSQRPVCKTCQKRGVDCEGYDVRLRWGSGIASRGHFTGADKPLKESVPPRPKGRRRDLSRERQRVQLEELEALLDQSSCDSDALSMTDHGSHPVQILGDWDLWPPSSDFSMNISPDPPLREQHKERMLFQECNYKPLPF